MRNKSCCSKCDSQNTVRVPDNPYRYTSGNNIYTTKATLFGKISVSRYVCCDCGYAENWVENKNGLNDIKHHLG